jgi:hypothetical protein
MLPRSSRSPFAPICFLSRSRLNPWSNSLRAPRAGRGRREERNSPDRRVDSRVDRAWFFHVSHGGRGTRVARQPRPSGQADRHRASQVSRTYSLSMQLVRCACESRSVLIPGDVTVMRPRRQGQKTERFSDDGRHACRWWWCRKRTRTYDWGMDGTAES